MAMSREQQDEQAKAYGRVVAKAWRDEAFKQQLLADPAATLKAEGVGVPEGTELRMVENSDALVYLTLPARPAGLSDEQLDQVAGGNAGEFCGPNGQYSWDTRPCIVVNSGAYCSG